MPRLLFTYLLCSGLNVLAQVPDLIPYRKGNLWGYADSTGTIKIQPQWDVICWPFDSDGHARVPVKYAINERDSFEYYTFIDKTGLPVIPHQRIVDICSAHSDWSLYIQMDKSNSTIRVSWGESPVLIFDFEGTLLCIAGPDYESEYCRLLNRQPVYTPFKIKFGRIKRQKGCYFTDNFGKQVSPSYHQISRDGDFNSYYLYSIKHWNSEIDSIVINPNGPAALVRKRKSWFFVDTNFNKLYVFPRHDVYTNFEVSSHPLDHLQLNKYTPITPCKQMSLICGKDGKCAYTNWSRKLVTKWEFDFPRNYWQYLNRYCTLPVMVACKDTLVGLVDTFGNFSIPLQYRELYPISGDTFLALDSVWHWIDAKGNIVSPHTFKSTQPFRSQYGKAFDTAWHFVDLRGNIVFETHFRQGYEMVEGHEFYLFFNARKRGFMDKYGREYFEE